MRVTATTLGCDTISFTATPADQVHLARIISTPGAYLLKNDPPCPAETTACQQDGMIAQHTAVLTGVGRGPFLCVFSANSKSQTAGWMARTRLAGLPEPRRLGRLDFAGRWTDGDTNLVAEASGSNAVALTGTAYWPDKFDPNGHEGHIAGIAVPNGPRLSVQDSTDPQGCHIDLVVIGRFLVAHDNESCGGENVSFSGVYTR